MQDIERGVVVVRARNDKEGIRSQIYQTMAITTQCAHNDIEIIDAVVTTSGGRAVIADIKHLKERKDFSTVLLFDYKQVARSEAEYEKFMAAMRELKLNVRVLRTD